jgi:hypothetical protein
VDHTAYHTATDLLGALVEAAIARIAAGDGRLSAVVVRDFERARRRSCGLTQPAFLYMIMSSTSATPVSRAGQTAPMIQAD